MLATHLMCYSSARPILATHLMVWQDHAQTSWWSPLNSSGYRVLSPQNEMRSVDWLNETLAAFHLDQVKSAGIEAVIVDLTNSFGEFLPRMPKIQRLCAARGLMLAAQVAGSAADIEVHAQLLWDTLVVPPDNQTNYWRIDSKPVLVLYTLRETYAQVKSQGGPYSSRFDVRWSSGEDSNPGKWGWQIEPWVGFEPSAESMFITPSTGHDPLKVAANWRKSLAWFDYGMLLAAKLRPAVVVVGSYDDVAERNAWLVADTSEDVPPERQMRDYDGALSNDALYNRVRAWSSGRPPASVPGGMLRDGAYRIRSIDAVMGLMLASTESSYVPSVGAKLVAASPSSGRRNVLHWYTSCEQCGRQVCRPGCEPYCCTQVADARRQYFDGATVSQIGCGPVLPTSAPLVCSGSDIYGVQNGTAPLFWLSHAGNSTYRIFALSTGLLLSSAQQDGRGIIGTAVTQEWPKAHSLAQLWVLEGSSADGFHVGSTGESQLQWELSKQGGVVLGAEGERWTFEPELTM